MAIRLEEYNTKEHVERTTRVLDRHDLTQARGRVAASFREIFTLNVPTVDFSQRSRLAYQTNQTQRYATHMTAPTKREGIIGLQPCWLTSRLTLSWQYKIISSGLGARTKFM